MKAQVRKAIQRVAVQRGIQLDHDDVEALVEAVAGSSVWVGDEEAMHLTRRTTGRSLADFCSKYDVTRIPLTNREELERALAGMPGRGNFPRRRAVGER